MIGAAQKVRAALCETGQLTCPEIAEISGLRIKEVRMSVCGLVWNGQARKTEESIGGDRGSTRNVYELTARGYARAADSHEIP